MAISFVQTIQAHSSSNVTSLGATFGSAVSAGDTLFVAFSTNTNNAQTFGVSDNINGTWTLIGSLFSQFNYQGQLYGFQNSAAAGAGGLTITITQTTSATMFMTGIEYSGLSTQDGTTQTTHASISSAGSGSAPNITTANANDLILGVAALSGNMGTVTTSAGYTVRPSGVSNGGSPIFAEQIVSSTNTYTGCSFTLQFGGNVVLMTTAWEQIVVVDEDFWVAPLPAPFDPTILVF